MDMAELPVDAERGVGGCVAGVRVDDINPERASVHAKKFSKSRTMNENLPWR